MVKKLKDRWEPAIELDEEPPVAVRKPGPPLQLASIRLFDLNGEVSTARTKQTCAPTWPIRSFDKHR
jgi:hypothetical protein